MEFTASAPGKAIFFGEHYVVYGAPALALPIEPRNCVEFSGHDKSLLLQSVFGEGRIFHDGQYSGPSELEPYAEVARKVFGDARIPAGGASFEPAWKLKGVGTSASLCAAFAAGLFQLAGKKPSEEEIFAAARAGDAVAHGGRASGIDARAVSSGKPLFFQRSFEPPRLTTGQFDFSLPPATVLLLVDTFKGRKDGTSAMLQKFALQFGITVAPSETPQEIRDEICEEYLPVWEKMQSVMKTKNPHALGEVMGENHALLRERGMSSEGIESAVTSAIAAGAYGAKLTGGGGEGGTVLVLCRAGTEGKIASAVSEEDGFGCYPLSLASRGAGVD